jgi:hypothetical protein
LVAPGAAQAAKPINCHKIALKGELASGDRFEKPIGGGLVFRLDPERLGPDGKLNGWGITLVPSRGSDKDQIYPVTPPLRFNGTQTLGPSYGEDAKTSLQRPHEDSRETIASDYDPAFRRRKTFRPQTAVRKRRLADHVRDRVGLVGANGTGKSTLMKVLAGIDTLDYGALTIAKGTSAGYLPQDGLDRSPAERFLPSACRCLTSCATWNASSKP